jgi:hypothetical protein
MKVGKICFLLVGVGMLVESLIGKKFLNTSEVGDAEDEGFRPRWFYRLLFASLSVAIIIWNAVKLYR